MKKGKSVICQSCGMPMVAHQHFGTNFDLSINQDYCCFCYQKGKYTKDITLIEYAEYLAKTNHGKHLKINDFHTLSLDEIALSEVVRLQQLDRWKSDKIHLEYHKAIYTTLEYIDKHLSKPINIQELAKLCHISEFHFYRIFKAILNESPLEYIQRLRIEKAGFLLQATSYTLSEIAEKVGYQSMHSLSKIFKQKFGVSPTCFKKHPISFKIRDKHPIINLNLVPHIVSIPSKDVLCVQVENPFERKDAFRYAWNKIVGFTHTNGIPDNQNEYISLFFDVYPLTLPEKYRIYACIHNNDIEQLKSYGIFTRKTIDGGLYAVFTHKGSHRDLNYIYCNIYRYWLPNSNYKLRDIVRFEKYLNSPNIYNENDLITEIYIPIE